MKTITMAELFPKSHLISLSNAGFEVVAYLNKSLKVDVGNGETRSEWLPRLCVAPGLTASTYRVIEWLPKGHPCNNYSSDGWQAMSGHTTGGFYEEIGQAIAWFDWHEKQKSR